MSSLCWQPNSTRFPLPWNIGTPRHWNPESKHRDIGTSGHWNPECTGRGKGTDLRTGKGHRPEEKFSLFRYPLGSHWRSLRCAFHCRAAHEAYDVLGGAHWLQVQFLVSLFPRLSRGGACPSLWVANFSNTVFLDLKPRTDKPLGIVDPNPCTSNLFGCSSIPPVPIWESATIRRLSGQDGRRLDAQASDHLFGGRVTCSEVDSPGAPAFNKAGDARAWPDTTTAVAIQGMREGVEPKCSGPSLHERAGRTKYSVVCATAGVTPLGLGGKLASAYRDVSQRPTHKKDTTRDSCCTLHLHHILCTRATARRDSSDSLRTARHVQAQRESRVTTQHLRSCLCQKQVHQPPRPSSLVRYMRSRAGGNWLPPIVTSRSAPHTKRTRHETAAVHCTCTISCAVHTRTPAQPNVGFHSFISFHFISFHFISFHFISFHFISFHFISFHFISFHFISFHFISFHFISFHFISFHFISFHFISFHFISFHFISFISFHFISFHFFIHFIHSKVCDNVCAVKRNTTRTHRSHATHTQALQT